MSTQEHRGYSMKCVEKSFGEKKTPDNEGIGFFPLKILFGKYLVLIIIYDHKNQKL